MFVSSLSPIKIASFSHRFDDIRQICTPGLHEIVHIYYLALDTYQISIRNQIADMKYTLKFEDVKIIQG
jgi:hypothetical protein